MNRSPRVGQTHKPGPFADSPDLTKMFHVKHFCPVGAQDLTRSKTAATPSRPHLQCVKLIDFPVRFESGAGNAIGRGELSAGISDVRSRLSGIACALSPFGPSGRGETVDARDLKSLDFGHTGSTPVVRTKAYGCSSGCNKLLNFK
jgi:hypothetical protein